MKISEIAARCPGFSLRFTPRNGWGWNFPSGDEPLGFEVIEKFGSFELLVTAGFRWKDEFRGLVGEIVEAGHPLLGYRFVLWSMCGNDPDLALATDGRWDLFFSRQSFRSDLLDFVEPDEAGVGYGFPSIDQKPPET